ncbi:MAG TPA: carboxypeptidase regulatory-like domain-containing protein [Pyrinomonadaceae bacterium]|nr:carboxypeptidase regulatory-like domain-containing protein [Pyrinomonadaceae bacterium]HMP64174.1 carboxypeptidase regulatory-like domain-containing protein [Pyrinomonadaceae bacterium]
MRSLIRSLTTSAVVAAFLVSGTVSISSAGNRIDGNAGTRSRERRSTDDDKKLAGLIRELTNRSTEGLVEEQSPTGGISLDLRGRFQQVTLGRLDWKGDPVAACVSSVEEANDFFGRDLDTGRPVPSISFLRDDLNEIAKRHGMSVDEYLFYSKLISDYAVNYALASPSSANIVIQNNDGVNEGFNDPTAAFVVGEGGNMGTTKGQQRLNVFNFAAGIWGAFLDSSVTTTIRSQFDPLTPCSSTGGVLGSAGALNLHANFASAPFANTWYSGALANKISGTDLNANPEIDATFNSSIDNGCLGTGTRFYYGLDNVTPSGRVNLLVVVLHEMGHGFGFQTFVNSSTGVMPLDLPDTYLRNMFDRTTGLYWHQMTNAERAASAINTNNVMWDGPSVRIASSFLTSGREAATGRVELFAPNPIQGGSSLSHFSSAATPNLLMEPSINLGLPLDLDLTRQLMRDIGWYRDTTADNVPDTITSVTPNSGTVVIGTNVMVTWINNGSFNRNVTIELSTDGGTTFPTTIASNVANTGSFTWTVPNSPTGQARVRVREAGFASPLGSSSGNFVISLTPSASNISISGRVLDHSGRGVRGAMVRAYDSEGNLKTALTNSFGFYRIEGLAAGQGYTLEARAKGLTFGQRFVIGDDDLTGIDMMPE